MEASDSGLFHRLGKAAGSKGSREFESLRLRNSCATIYSMKKNTLCFPIRGEEVLLGMKKRGFGEGKWNGYGGKVTPEESATRATVRELEEESMLRAKEEDLEHAGVVRFYFDTVPTIECDVFLLRAWEGEPEETEEMRPQWFTSSDLPYHEMWVADGMWIPILLSGKKIEAEVYFNADGSEVNDFTYREITL